MILKPCPFCHKEIPRSITVCPYCHRDEKGKSIVMDSALVEIPESDRRLQEDLAALSSDDPYTREQAIVQLSQRGSAAVPALMSILNDFSKPGLAGVARALGKIGEKRAVSVLAHAAKLGDEELRMGAVWALAQIHDPESLPSLLREAERPHPVVQSFIAFTLGTFQDARVVPVLSKLAIHPNREVAFQASCALGEVGGQDSIRALKKAWRKGDNLVRAASASALRRLGARPSRIPIGPWLVCGMFFASLGAGLAFFFYK